MWVENVRREQGRSEGRGRNEENVKTVKSSIRM